MTRALLLALVLVGVASAPALAREEVAGPVAAEILRVIDGDTLLVEARPWPQQKMEVYVRIRGIDAPEIKSKCARFSEAGMNARQALEILASASPQIQLTHISGDKYFGRIVADVILSDGRSAAEGLLRAGLVNAYDGGRKPREACPVN
ncbi:nuclease [Neorhizobium sp. SOG26]|uniref:thermonuclease family protein n=1 Tax=Neorhizobium sp. SOG26 TaxID=2060726 RepID=UPI000E57D28B|nr:thermonuclease family protein [Neorhizobium sp. SOG26]AXV16870.1 nuclease [Neorhizobium sp. SOG26]